MTRPGKFARTVRLPPQPPPPVTSQTTFTKLILNLTLVTLTVARNLGCSLNVDLNVDVSLTWSGFFVLFFVPTPALLITLLCQLCPSLALGYY